ncbi:hypothetical protein Ddye_032269 [Dipteronia dyeriana]|uniref:Reverse transcriptase domain-containing protein n=1 Tax=Dipteronia dyeriana TaxID=168575 RepID=A0AAD9TJX8_9ROSI|nr:hypothetical protein Ddye_032269 [Dipteronia dyeriana]
MHACFGSAAWHWKLINRNVKAIDNIASELVAIILLHKGKDSNPYLYCVGVSGIPSNQSLLVTFVARVRNLGEDHIFLDDVRKDMGLSEKRRKWMGCYISSPTLSVLVNESLTREFGLERGLRQSDPFSLRFFSTWWLKFADDTILFLQPNTKYLSNARRILRYFELASGLRRNLQKSSVVRVRNKGGGEEDWVAIFSYAKWSLPFSYLGLQLRGRPSTKLFWADVVRKVKSILAPWKKVFLNKGGRVVLIKNVMASIPIYYMSVFKMPVCVALKLEKLQRIGSILLKNKGLLAKWAWRFGKEEALLWKRVICIKYGISKDNLRWDWKYGVKCSTFEKAVGSLFEQGSRTTNILTEGLGVVVAKGDKARFWVDVLVDSIPLKMAFPRNYTLAVNKSESIRDYWLEDNMGIR